MTCLMHNDARLQRRSLNCWTICGRPIFSTCTGTDIDNLRTVIQDQDFSSTQIPGEMSDTQTLKRSANAPVDDDSDDDFGPMPAAAPAIEAADDVKTVKKARKILPFEKTYIDSLPSASMYERSFMHRDLVTHISVAKSAEFIITGSCDGHVKFWKKMPDNIEFVKHFQAHLGTISYQHHSFLKI